MAGQLLDTYRSRMKIAMVNHFQYRLEMVVQLLRIMLEPIIYLVVWQVTARSSGGDVAGYTADDFALYFIMWAFVRHLTTGWAPGMFEWRIRQGDLNPMLLRPIHPIHVDTAEMLGWKIVELVILVPTLAVLWLVFQPQWTPVWWSLVAFVPAVVIGFVLRYMAMYDLALLAFWTTRLDAIFNAWFLTEFFTSGRIAPLGVLPPWMHTIANVLPFQWMFAFPLELILGNLTPQQMGIGFAVQIGWVAVAFGGFFLLWRNGTRRYGAVGG